MKLPNNILHSIDCPCGQTAKLEWKYTYLSALHKYLSYYCNSCKNAFTTTKSDEISLIIFNSKKRSIKRKNKIIKINNEL